MSEEEIIKECSELAKNEHHELGDCWDEEYSSKAIERFIRTIPKGKRKNRRIKKPKCRIKRRIRSKKCRIK